MSSILAGDTIKGNNMKTIFFENVRNKEQFFSKNTKDVQTIDGIEYMRVFRVGTDRECLVKKDILKKINKLK